VLPRLWTPVRWRWWSVLSSPGGGDQLYSDRGTPDGSGLPGIRLSGLRGAALELYTWYDPRRCPATAIWVERGYGAEMLGNYTGTFVDPLGRQTSSDSTPRKGVGWDQPPILSGAEAEGLCGALDAGPTPAQGRPQRSAA